MESSRVQGGGGGKYAKCWRRGEPQLRTLESYTAPTGTQK